MKSLLKKTLFSLSVVILSTAIYAQDGTLTHTSTTASTYPATGGPQSLGIISQAPWQLVKSNGSDPLSIITLPISYELPITQTSYSFTLAPNSTWADRTASIYVKSSALNFSATPNPILIRQTFMPPLFTTASQTIDFGAVTTATPKTASFTINSGWAVTGTDANYANVVSAMTPVLNAVQTGSTSALTPVTGTVSFTPNVTNTAAAGTVYSTNVTLTSRNHSPATAVTNIITLKKTVPAVWTYIAPVNGGTLAKEAQSLNIQANTNAAWAAKTSLTAQTTVVAGPYGLKTISASIPENNTFASRSIDVYANAGSTAATKQATLTQSGYVLYLNADDAATDKSIDFVKTTANKTVKISSNANWTATGGVGNTVKSYTPSTTSGTTPYKLAADIDKTMTIIPNTDWKIAGLSKDQVVSDIITLTSKDHPDNTTGIIRKINVKRTVPEGWEYASSNPANTTPPQTIPITGGTATATANTNTNWTAKVSTGASSTNTISTYTPNDAITLSVPANASWEKKTITLSADKGTAPTQVRATYEQGFMPPLFTPASQTIDFGAVTTATPKTASFTINSGWAVTGTDANYANVVSAMTPVLNAVQTGSTSALTPVAGTVSFTPNVTATAAAGTVYSTDVTLTSRNHSPATTVTNTITLKRTVPAMWTYVAPVTNAYTIPIAGQTINIQANSNVAWAAKTNLTSQSTVPSGTYGLTTITTTIPANTTFASRTVTVSADQGTTASTSRGTLTQLGNTLYLNVNGAASDHTINFEKGTAATTRPITTNAKWSAATTSNNNAIASYTPTSGGGTPPAASSTTMTITPNTAWKVAGLKANQTVSGVITLTSNSHTGASALTRKITVNRTVPVGWEYVSISKGSGTVATTGQNGIILKANTNRSWSTNFTVTAGTAIATQTASVSTYTANSQMSFNIPAYNVFTSTPRTIKVVTDDGNVRATYTQAGCTTIPTTTTNWATAGCPKTSSVASSFRGNGDTFTVSPTTACGIASMPMTFCVGARGKNAMTCNSGGQPGSTGCPMYSDPVTVTSSTVTIKLKKWPGLDGGIYMQTFIGELYLFYKDPIANIWKLHPQTNVNGGTGGKFIGNGCY